MTDPNASPEEPSAPKHDVRRSVQTDMGVRIERDMTNSSDWLARGSKTHFSKIKFHSQGRSFVGEPTPAVPAPERPTDPPAVAAVVEAAPSLASAAHAEPKASGGFLARLKSFFGR